jgi:hypothetical protein
MNVILGSFVTSINHSTSNKMDTVNYNDVFLTQKFIRTFVQKRVVFEFN